MRELREESFRQSADLRSVAALQESALVLGVSPDPGLFADAIGELNRRVGEALVDGESSRAKAFAEFGIDPEEISRLSGLDQIRAVVSEIEGLDFSQYTFGIDELFGGEGSEGLAQLIAAASAEGREFDEVLASVANRSFVANIEELNESELAWSRTKQQLADITTELSTGLVPAFSGVLEAAAPALRWVADFTKENEGATQALFGVVGVLGVASLGVRVYGLATGVATAATTAYTTAKNSERLATVGSTAARGASLAVTGLATAGTWALTGATWAFGAALTFATGPIGLTIIGLGALAAGGYVVYRNWETIKDGVGEFWDRWGGWITTGLAVFAPFIGVPLLVYRNWETLTGGVIDFWEGLESRIGTGVYTVLGYADDLLEAFNAIPLVPDVDTSGLESLRRELGDSLGIAEVRSDVGLRVRSDFERDLRGASGGLHASGSESLRRDLGDSLGTAEVRSDVGLRVRSDFERDLRGASGGLHASGSESGGVSSGLHAGGVVDNSNRVIYLDQRNEISGATDAEEVADLIGERTGNLVLDSLGGGLSSGVSVAYTCLSRCEMRYKSFEGVGGLALERVYGLGFIFA